VLIMCIAHDEMRDLTDYKCNDLRCSLTTP
jgi:hypothetical protein